MDIGDTIAIHYLNRIYWIDILQVQPGEAISIIDADVNVEFAPPADMETKSSVENNSASSSLPRNVSIYSIGKRKFVIHTHTHSLLLRIWKIQRAMIPKPILFQASQYVMKKDSCLLWMIDSKAKLEQRRNAAIDAFRNARKGQRPVVDSDSESSEEEGNPTNSFVPFSGEGRSLRGTVSSKVRLFLNRIFTTFRNVPIR